MTRALLTHRLLLSRPSLTLPPSLPLSLSLRLHHPTVAGAAGVLFPSLALSRRQSGSQVYGRCIQSFLSLSILQHATVISLSRSERASERRKHVSNRRLVRRRLSIGIQEQHDRRCSREPAIEKSERENQGQRVFVTTSADPLASQTGSLFLPSSLMSA